MGAMATAKCGTREGAALWCNLDPCGLVCAAITYFLIAYAQYAVTTCVLAPWMGYSFLSLLNMCCFNAMACLAHAAHIRAMLTDPGAVSAKAEPPTAELEAGGAPGGTSGGDSRRFCRKCDAYKPIRAHHCSICQRCIVKMDHHCPWVNNCVGIGNHKFFLQFVSYVFAISAYALALVFARFMMCINNPRKCLDPHVNMLTVILVVEAILFGMFTLCMVCDQWEVVSTNQTQIDRLQGQVHVPQSSKEINELFGGARNGRWWSPDRLLPTRVIFPPDVWEDVMGYRCRDTNGLAASRSRPRTEAGPNSSEAEGDANGDMELTDVYSRGLSGSSIRERKQGDSASQRLLSRDSPTSDLGTSGGNAAHATQMLPSASGSSAASLLVASVSVPSHGTSNGTSTSSGLFKRDGNGTGAVS